jgi:hypothetical protein
LFLEHVILRQSAINMVHSLLFSVAAIGTAATACAEEDPDTNGNDYQGKDEDQPPGWLTHPVAQCSATPIACKGRGQAKARTDRAALKTQATVIARRL